MSVVAGIALALLVIAFVAVVLLVQVWILRAGLEPVREQLQRIADEIEIANDAADEEEAVG